MRVASTCVRLLESVRWFSRRTPGVRLRLCPRTREIERKEQRHMAYIRATNGALFGRHNASRGHSPICFSCGVLMRAYVYVARPDKTETKENGEKFRIG